MQWISEEVDLPKVKEKVLLCMPRQHTEFWDIYMAMLVIRHEGVLPLPIRKGSPRWPTDYYWARDREGHATALVTGNAWWSKLDAIELPPGAEHRIGRDGGHYIAQPKDIWVGQSGR